MKYGYPSGYNDSYNNNLIDHFEVLDEGTSANIDIYFVGKNKMYVQFPYDEKFEEYLYQLMMTQSNIRNKSAEKFFIEMQQKKYIWNAASMTTMGFAALTLQTTLNTDIFIPVLLAASGFTIYNIYKYIKFVKYELEIKKHEVYMNLYNKYLKYADLELSSDGEPLNINTLDRFTLYEVKDLSKNVDKYFKMEARKREKGN